MSPAIDIDSTELEDFQENKMVEAFQVAVEATDAKVLSDKDPELQYEFPVWC